MISLAAIDFASLGLFALAVAVLVAALVLLSGFLPLRGWPGEAGGVLGLALLVLAGLSAVALAVCALRFAFGRLDLAPAVIAGGLALLVGPLLFQSLPRRLRDSTGGLVVTLLVSGALAVVLDQAGRS